MTVSDKTLARLKQAAGPRGYLDDPEAIAPYCTPFRDGWVGETPLVLRPDTTEMVAALVRICAETGTPIVPQGGNTGMTGGGLPHPGGDEVILSTGRLNRIRGIDPLNDTITAEAGVVLADIRSAAEGVDRLFPLLLGAQGSCQIGGNLSTNAGGINVVRYGNVRSMVLGLEVVTGDGEVWDGLRALRKDNAGYDLKHIFIGAEGTLGIITAAVLRLVARPRERQTALVEVADPQAAVELLARLRGAMGDVVSAFELMHRNCFTLATRTLGHADPMPGQRPWRVLLDLTGQQPPGALREPLEEVLADALEAGLVSDAIVAASGAQADALWRIREDQAEVQRQAGKGIKHDISVPVSLVPDFIARADAAMERAYPGHVVCTFGHLGDGNIHYNPIEPPGWEQARWVAETGPINRIVHDIVADLGGSITAEHGVGRLRLAELVHYKSAVEIDLMRRLKRAFDPANILNPGKVLPAQGG
ncbi:MAG: FAD-binding oxidoreductase [Proteobacteria bacterium]|nr:FAD-binding oxidoreductase [Pseudomonadota bacterium]